MGVDGPCEPPDGDDPERRSVRELPGLIRTVDPVATERAQKFGSRTIQRLIMTLDHTPDNGDRGPDHWSEVEDPTRKPDRERIHLTEERVHHILTGDLDRGSGGHRHGSRIPDKHTFPPDWDDRKILSAILDVARHPDWTPRLQGHGTWKAEGWRDDVHVVAIIRSDAMMRTGFPDEGRGVHINDRHGDPIPMPWPERE